MPVAYDKLGSLTPGAVPSGVQLYNGATAGSVTTAGRFSGTSAKGGVTGPYTKTGSLAAGTRSSAADVYNSVETGSLSPTKLNSGTSTKIVAGGYVKTGSVTTSASLSGASVRIGSAIYQKTGALVIDTSLRGSRTGGTIAVAGRPVVSAVADELYEILKPLAYADQSLGWPLLLFCEAVSNPVQVVKDVGVDWSQILDVDRAPYDGLPWLAQLVGSTLGPMLTGESTTSYDTRSRSYIRATPGFNRGTPAAMVAAIQQYLTGTKSVILRERAGGPYKLQIRTKTAETPSTAAVLQAIATQKPAGITLDYATIAGQDYQTLYTTYATYQLVYTTYLTYNGVYLALPGT